MGIKFPDDLSLFLPAPGYVPQVHEVPVLGWEKAHLLHKTGVGAAVKLSVIAVHIPQTALGTIHGVNFEHVAGLFQVVWIGVVNPAVEILAVPVVFFDYIVDVVLPGKLVEFPPGPGQFSVVADIDTERIAIA